MSDPLTPAQKQALEFLRVQDQPFSSADLHEWRIQDATLDILVAYGHVRPCLGGWTTHARGGTLTRTRKRKT